MSKNKFKAKVSNQGRRRVINVPNKNKDFQSGDEVEVKKRLKELG